MTEKAVMVALIAFYAVLICICLWMLYQIYNAIMEIIREMLIDAYEDGRNYAREKEKQEENYCTGQTEGGTELSGSYGRDAEEEEGEQWQKKKS